MTARPGPPPDQLGFVTDDLAAMVATVSRLWNESDWQYRTYDQTILRFSSFRGAPGRFSSRNAVAPDGRLGIVQPVDGPSVHLEALERRGPGLAYVSWFVEDLAGATEHLRTQGCDEVMRGGGHGLDGDGEFVYFDTVAALGVYSQYAVRPRRRPPAD